MTEHGGAAPGGLRVRAHATAVVLDAAENLVDPVIFPFLSFWMEEWIRGCTCAAARLQTDGTKVDRFA